jgi:hypothetical protein
LAFFGRKDDPFFDWSLLRGRKNDEPLQRRLLDVSDE